MKTLRVWRKEGKTGQSKTHEYDPDYGLPNKEPRKDYRLAAISWEGKVLEGTKLFLYMRESIFGDGENQPFLNFIPPLPKLPSQYIHLEEYNWKPYPAERPTEFGKDYDLGLKLPEGNWRILNIFLSSESDLELLDMLSVNGIITHFRKKRVPGLPCIEPNPDYPIAVEQRNQNLILLEELLRKYFVVTATHLFPALPLNEILSANLVEKYGLNSSSEIDPDMLWHWTELVDGKWENIPVDAKHPLAIANPNTTIKGIRKVLKNTPSDFFRLVALRADGLTDSTEQMKKMLGI